MSTQVAKTDSVSKTRRSAGVSRPALCTALPDGAQASTVGGSPGILSTGRFAAHKLPAIVYQRSKGVDAYVRAVSSATPMEIVAIERQGVQGIFIKDLSKRMDLATSRVFSILGVPKATAEKKAAAGGLVTGSGGQAAIGMIKLLGIAQGIVENSTAPEAKGFDAAKWLGQWIEQPQPSLGGRKPADLIDTPTGVDLIARLLGSIESGAYQ